MSLRQRLSKAYAALFGQEPYALQSNPSRLIGNPGVRTRERLRRRNKNRVQPISIDRSRWLRRDIEEAEFEANSGNLRRAAQIGEWVRADLTVGGLLSTRCSVPRLPRVWRGNEQAREWLEGSGKMPGIFDAIFPPAELEELAIDHLVDGVGIGVFIRPKRCKYVKLVRLDPQWLQYRVGENRWVYQGYNRLYDVDPGDGTWILHKNGEVDPWRRGIWAELGRDQCSEDTAGMHRDAFIAKFGNPFVIATATQGESEEQKLSFWKTVLVWTMGFAGVTPGHKVELLQPKAEGREVFTDAENKVERRAMMRIAGQIVTSLGGPGFANAEIFQQIASHLVARTGQDLATTLNEQGIQQVIEMGVEDGWIESNDPFLLGYDTTPPQARKAEAEAISAAMDAFIKQWEAADKAQDPSLRPSVEEYRARFRLPVASSMVGNINDMLRGMTSEERRALFAQYEVANQNAPLEVSAQPKGDEPTIDHAAKLAEEMTLHQMQECEHGCPNRCPRCGVERARGIVLVEGKPTWRLAWRPIAQVAA